MTRKVFLTEVDSWGIEVRLLLPLQRKSDTRKGKRKVKLSL
jgi:hypothetical protein